MASARQRKEEMLIERHAERAAVRAVRGISFTHCLKLNNIDPAYTATDETGEKIVIQGRDVYNKKTWEKYLAQRTTPLEMGWLTGNAGITAIDYARWLRTGYTKRYQSIRSFTGREWLKKSARVTVLLRMAEHKRETHNFIDDVAERDMDNVHMAKEFSRETNEAINHAMKHNEDAEGLMEKIYLKYLSLLEKREPIPYESLPELPAGIDPLAMPEDEEDEGDE